MDLQWKIQQKAILFKHQHLASHFYTNYEAIVSSLNCNKNRSVLQNSCVVSLEGEAPKPRGSMLFLAECFYKHRESCSGYQYVMCKSRDNVICPQLQKMSCGQLSCMTNGKHRMRQRTFQMIPPFYLCLSDALILSKRTVWFAMTLYRTIKWWFWKWKRLVFGILALPVWWSTINFRPPCSGSKLQTTYTGILRAMLCQILEASPELIGHFIEALSSPLEYPTELRTCHTKNWSIPFALGVAGLDGEQSPAYQYTWWMRA